jgi:prolyl-tRNA editing enzyme YbaK/EbsC (Cys-tRNA(Pro) deacylase)
MSVERVKEYFKKEFGREDIVQETKESSATVAEAAKAIGTEECRIAKTLAFALKDQVILLVVAGDARVDNKKFKETFGLKAKMLAFDLTEELTGFAPGGVCPFGVKEGVEIYLDDSLKRFPSVFPAAGSGHSHVEMTMAELEHFIHFKEWVDVTKLPM